MTISVLLVECLDRRGLVLAISGVLFDHGCNVVGNQEFVDRETGRFFMRTEFDGAVDSVCLAEEAKGVLPEGAAVQVASPLPKRIVVLVSREHHCLADLLIRHQFGTLNARIEAVIGAFTSCR
ncbi:MAG: ACT domain-containing protein [Pedosphaera sp.]|nr:ACT domain-containing protein [Pedosphaera sp.]